MIKPSEMTPNCAKVIKKLVERYFEPEVVQVVLGSVPETTALLQKRWDNLSKKRKQKIKDKAQKLEQEYQTLQELRKARELTQVHMAKALNVRQESISKLENRSDMMLSTLRGYIEAMGGELNLVVSFPEQEPIKLNGLLDLSE